MKTPYTPGPWSAFNYSWCETSIIAQGFDHGICSLDINHATEESQEADEAQMAANARLIAAAPDLLEALKPFSRLLQKHHDSLPDSQPIYGIGDALICVYDMRMAVAAIAKATGEQP